MIAVALKGLAGRKLRSALTALAIVLGVAMVSGTFVLTDTIKKGFDAISAASYKNTDVTISGKSAFASNADDFASPGFPDSVLARVRALPDVAAASGSVEGAAKLIDRSGKTIRGTPNATSVEPGRDQRFNPLTLVRGSWPSGPGQIAIDEATATGKGFAVGDTIAVSSRQPLRRFRISGIAKLAGVSSIGTLAVFDLPTAQQLLDKRGKLDRIRLAARPGVLADELVREVRPLLPPTAQVKSAAAQVKAEAKTTASATSVVRYGLLGFAAIALLVGGFVIANTLAITIAQRVRELATLRAIGASRRQVLRSVLLEALTVGLAASLLGLAVGIGLAKGLTALLGAVGWDLPEAGLVFGARTVVVSVVVGVVITLLASLRPALRATRVPPIAAVREGFVLPRSRLARLGPAPGLAVLGGGVLLLVYGVFGHGLSIASRLLSLGGGCLLLFYGIALLAPRLVRPLAFLLGWPGTRVGGAAGRLARENATRNPSRTASTAAALMIGLGLVTFVAILGQGLRSSFEDAVGKLFVADYALTSGNNGVLTTAAASAAAKTPGVEVVSGLRGGEGRIFGKTIHVNGAEPNLATVIRLDWYRGSSAVPARLGRDGAFVEKKYAKRHGLVLGSPLRLETTTGKRLALRLEGIFQAPKGGSPFGEVTISAAAFDNAYPQPSNDFAFVDMRGGVSKANTAALERSLRGFPEAEVASRSRFKKNMEKDLDTLLNMVYALLGLSVLISLFGIVNTLVLTVFERTRELGMLRAVGMTRRQVRRMIRHESIVTSLIGTALGIAVGIFLSLLVTRALSDEGIVFALPYRSLAAFVLAAIAVGILAAILPARRAARLNVLEALQYE
jgi:putative ABC transport system permease protein